MIIKKHLRRQKIHAAIHFMFQIDYIILLMLRLHMSFRITRGSYTKVSLPPDIFDQFTGISIMIRKREFMFCRNISS